MLRRLRTIFGMSGGRTYAIVWRVSGRQPALIDCVAQTLGCDPALAALVAEQARVASHAPQAVILASGDASDLIFLVVAGRARMLAYSIDGRLVVVRDFGVGDLFGEGGLLGQSVNTNDIVAVDHVDTGVFKVQVFVGLMSHHACIALAVSRLMVARLAATTQRLVEGATLTATGRIHAELLRRARAGNAMTISPPPVLSTFALTVQSTRETVSRTISALEKRGIIQRSPDALKVVAPHRLEELIF
jgi:CRP/FNR family transcriptional regulator, cyclic AMP receptor protein